MFTGIVTDVGRVRAISDTNRDRRFEIATRFDLSTVDIGASISHAGCCLIWSAPPGSATNWAAISFRAMWTASAK